MSNLGQWEEAVLEELHVQAELACDAFFIPWAQKSVAMLIQQLSWDLLEPSDAQTSAGPSSPARDQGVPTVAEGEILPGFPGVAIP